ncbi:MAG: flagellar protein FlaG [Pseudomonadales bacterium]|jgi:flagellar protein FlaG|nr:flagellar protein FlaG [Pseudomonadales bacterium]
MTTDPIADVTRLLRAEPAAVEAAARVVGAGRQGTTAGGQTLPDTGRSENARAALDAAIADIGEALGEARRQLSFRIDDDLGRVVVRVSDAATGELVRQVPAEHVVAIAKMLRESNRDAERVRGFMVDERA